MVESCSTCARSGRPRSRRDRAHAGEVLEPERDRLDEDVERVDVALARERLRLVHPAVRGEARRHGVREQPGEPHRLRRRAPPARGRAARPAPRRRARARSPSCPRTPSCRAASSSAREPLRLREHVVVGRRRERPRRRRDAAAEPRDLLVRHAGDLALVLLGAPAGERQVRVAVDEAGQHRAAASRRPPRPAPSSVDVARLEASARPRGRGAGRGGPSSGRSTCAAPRRAPSCPSCTRSPASRIGIRTPSRSAASIASG